MKSITVFFCLMLVIAFSGCRPSDDKGFVTTCFTYADFKEERQLSNPQELFCHAEPIRASPHI